MKRRSLQAQLDETLRKANCLSKQIGELFKSKAQEANDLKSQTGALKETSKELSEQLNNAEDALRKSFT
jgi:seryl-tRNA synthetase